MQFYLPIFLLFTVFACSETEDPIISGEENLTYNVSGTIRGEANVGVSVTVNSVTVMSDLNGFYSFRDLVPGTYDVVPSKEGLIFSPEVHRVTITDDSWTSIDFISSINPPSSSIVIGGNTFSFFNPDVFEIEEIQSNSLRLDLSQNAIWYHNGQAGLVYTEVTGDFVFVARVNATKTSDYQEEVECDVCLGGLMARNPNNDDGENYVHIVTGVTPVGLGVETKNTVDGVSDFTPVNEGIAHFDLRIIREGSLFTLSKKPVTTDDWEVTSAYTRMDLPNTLQIGMNIYTSVQGDLADLSVFFEEVTLEKK